MNPDIFQNRSGIESPILVLVNDLSMIVFSHVCHSSAPLTIGWVQRSRKLGTSPLVHVRTVEQYIGNVK